MNSASNSSNSRSSGVPGGSGPDPRALFFISPMSFGIGPGPGARGLRVLAPMPLHMGLGLGRGALPGYLFLAL